jgi:hypothetical protein
MVEGTCQPGSKVEVKVDNDKIFQTPVRGTFNVIYIFFIVNTKNCTVFAGVKLANILLDFRIIYLLTVKIFP